MLDIPGLHEQAVKKSGVCESQNDFIHAALSLTVKDPLTLSVSKIEEDYTYNDLYVKFTNNSKKKIVYVKFDITQYNNREDKLKSPYSFYYLNEDLAPRSYDTYKYWVHDDTKSADLTIKEVTFSDGTKWKP